MSIDPVEEHDVMVARGAMVPTRGMKGDTGRARGDANLSSEKCVFYLLEEL